MKVAMGLVGWEQTITHEILCVSCGRKDEDRICGEAWEGIEDHENNWEALVCFECDESLGDVIISLGY